MGLFDFFKKNKTKKQEKYKLGMHKTRENSFGSIKKILEAKNAIDDELFDELEEVFIMADVGVDTVISFIDDLRDEVTKQGITEPKQLQEIIIDKMFEIYLKGEVVNANLNLNKNGLSVVLFVGVNGVGKTTSIAKIAYQLKKEGKKVLLAAGDTFRAGAIEQLATWAKKVGVDIVYKDAGSDPSSVMFDAVNKAKNEGYDVDVAFTAEQALTYDLKKYSLILLDIMMGEISGIKMAKILKENVATAEIPIIFCTARDTEDDMIMGLNIGADDYIMKPYTIRNVIARVKSVLRRTLTHKNIIITDKPDILKVDGLQLDLGFKRCTIEGREIKLAKKEFELLAYLISNRGKICSREQILNSVWSDEVVVLDRTIDVNITRLRSKIGEYGSYIITRSGFGYGFRD